MATAYLTVQLSGSTLGEEPAPCITAPTTPATACHATTPAAKSQSSYDSIDTDDDAIWKKLRAGEIALWQTRKRMGAFTLSVACCCAGACAAINVCNFLDLELVYATVLTLDTCCSITHLTLTVVLLFAPLADDMVLSRYVCLMEALFIFSYGPVRTYTNVVGDGRGIKTLPSLISMLAGQEELDTYTIWLAVNTVLYGSTSAMFVLGAISAMNKRTAMHIQSRMWATMQAYAFLCFSVEVSGAMLLCKQFPNHDLLHWSLAVPYMTADVIMFTLATFGMARQTIQASLRRVLMKKQNVAASAGIAGLMTNSSPAEVLTLAKKRFRCMSAADLTFDDLMASPTQIAASTKLIQRTKSVRLGKCDAFVSHSWHDDVIAKWECFQEWRKDFKEANGREPLIWFDKFCIDQTDIETDLRGLPVFLSGCKELVVLCGPTYLTRLWCVVEIFTFVHMGGALNRIIFKSLVRKEHEEEDSEKITEIFDSFDGNNCNCIVQADKDKMLGIIMAAYGSMDAFNDEVQNITKMARRVRGGGQDRKYARAVTV
eukprot:TRINITY_DN10024_c0_g2_i3.p1 TRINITY_DN10024_c0_g2~~TRINITY_DN10024_c0_g2_i3.p1  ORF type:complete len:564 (-),score=109.05 TRINITY_DN10024_c0_g2_i3:1072-2700(-)